MQEKKYDEVFVMRKWLFVLLAFAACENATAPGGSAGMTAASITVRGPAKTEYTIGESFAGEELFVTAHYDNGWHGTLTNYTLSWNGASLTDGDTAITADAGEKTVTVSYEGKSATFTIVVNAPGSPVLMDITLTGPDKTIYTMGEAFSSAGLVVTAHYSTTAVVTNYTLSWDGASLTDGDTAITAAAGEKTVTVTYEGKSATFTIMVNAPSSPVLMDITFTGPDKTIYTRGEAFDSAGLVVTAHYSSTAVVTDYTLSWVGASLTDGDTGITAAAGEKTVTVSYEDKSAAFTIMVNAPSITVTFNAAGGTFDADGGSSETQTMTVPSGGSLVDMPEEPTKTGFTFSGWYTLTDDGDTGFTVPTIVTAALTVYAKWEIASAEGLVAFLSTATGGETLDDPIPVKIRVNLADNGWEAILAALVRTEKYVTLDLSGCDIPGTEFDPGAARTGEKYITGLVLPSEAESINGGSIPSPTFENFPNLKTLSATGVTLIGTYAFLQCPSLTTVSLPAATSIGNEAFSDCTSLATVSLPAAASIGSRAFHHCSSLTTVSLPEAASIGSSAFYDCSNLTEVSLPAAASIGSSAFSYCPSLTMVSLPAMPPTIADSIFTNTSGSSMITTTVPDAAAVTAYTNVWGVGAVTPAGGNTSVYGDSHAAVTIAAAP
jgi:uncharacterized repeat protein (TIGR02543 family)